MSLFEDVMEVEDRGLDNALSMQRLINAGQWSLQGSFGRDMMAAIDIGLCLLGTESARDYYGNRIPSRDEVKPDTKGSYDFVVRHYGEEHAEAMANA